MFIGVCLILFEKLKKSSRMELVMNGLISVIIPTYNRRNVIMKSVESVLGQTYKNLELIIVDDASTDETYQLFENIYDKRLKYLRYEKNQGACYARNYGVDHAVGEYIAFQDSDDIWHPTKLEEEMHLLIDDNSDIVFCGMNRRDSRHTFYYPATDIDLSGNIVEQILTDNVISTQTMLMKRKVLDDIKFDVSFKRFQDWDFSLQAALNNYKISYLKKALVDSKIQANSISVSAKTGMAYEHLFEKYRIEYEKYPHALATIYMNQARGYRQVDKKKVDYYLTMSLKAEWSGKTAIKKILNLFGLWKK